MTELLQPPMSIEAEQAVLGGLMLDNLAIGYVLDGCGESDFYSRNHRQIFRAILACDEAGEPFDTISLAEKLQKDGALDDVGGIQALSAMVSNTPSAANIKTYARIVREKSLERQLASVSTEIHELAFNPTLKPQEKIDNAGALLMRLTDDKSSTGPQRVSNAMPAWVQALDERFTNGGEITGLSTGFGDVDKITAGLQKADLIILAGRPSMGKSTLAMNIAENLAVVKDIPGAVFSLEMPTNQLVDRCVSSLGRVSHQSIRTGQLNPDEWPIVTSAATRINKAPLFIDETPGLTTSELRNRARRLKKQEGIEFIVVDYLQLMRCNGSENRQNEISEISRTLKLIAKELNIPVIALSQLSRALEQRQNKRPIMSDLRESGGIEQDADVIAFIYRDEVYNEDSPDKGTAELIFRKQRNGLTGTVRLAFNGQYSRFDSLSFA